LLGFPRVDKAHAKVVDRQRNRNRPSWKQMQEQFSFEVACAKYEEAPTVGSKKTTQPNARKSIGVRCCTLTGE